MIFYAPLRGMREVRDRSGLGPAVICAYLVQVAYTFLILWLAGDRAMFSRGAGTIASYLFQAVAPILTVAVVIVPVTILIANLFDRRGGFSVVLQQEYGSLASVAFYALTAASIITILAAAFFHLCGIQGSVVADAARWMDTEQMRKAAQDAQWTPDQPRRSRLCSATRFWFPWPCLNSSGGRCWPSVLSSACAKFSDFRSCVQSA